MRTVTDAPRYRLFCTPPLVSGLLRSLDPGPSHRLRNVLRCAVGDHVALFDGVDGEWRARIVLMKKNAVHVEVTDRLRPQSPPGALRLLFAPVKRDRMESLVRKATEMGVGSLRPVLTERTEVRRIDALRLRAYVIEAAEQCGISSIPDLESPIRCDRLTTVLPDRPEQGGLVFCDEDAPVGAGMNDLDGLIGGEVSVLVGPEGGFSDSERAILRARKDAYALSLGPRILCADTAVTAVLTLLQSRIGDWSLGR